MPKKYKTDTKLTKKQKIILLVATCFLLAIVITSTVFIAKSRKESKSLEKSISNPKKPSSPPSDKNDKSPEPEEEKDEKVPDNTQTLVQKRREAINILETKINSENIKTTDLLSELKTKHGLSNTETD